MRRALVVLALLAFAASPLWSGGLLDPREPAGRAVVLGLRVPRILCGFLGGAALALSGALFQGMFRNPLATPYTLGMATGASLAVALGVFLGAGGWGLAPLSFAGAGATALLLLLAASAGPRLSTDRLLLAGVAVALFGSSVVGVLRIVGDAPALASFLDWTLGSTDVHGTAPVLVCLLALAVLLAFSALRRAEVTVLSASAALAPGRGVDPDRLRREILLAVSLATSLVVSQLGPVGFVGLVVPNLLREAGLGLFRRHFPHCLLAGGLFLSLVDSLSRTLLPVHLPVGSVMALVGTPFFVLVLAKGRRAP